MLGVAVTLIIIGVTLFFLFSKPHIIGSLNKLSCVQKMNKQTLNQQKNQRQLGKETGRKHATPKCLRECFKVAIGQRSVMDHEFQHEITRSFRLPNPNIPNGTQRHSSKLVLR